MPTETRPGLELPLRIVLLGPHAVRPLLQIISDVGRRRRLGPQQVTFRLVLD